MAKSDSADSPLHGVLAWNLDAIHRRCREAADGALADLGLSLRTHWFLASLNSPVPQSQRDVAEALHMDRSDIVRLVDLVEGKGWVNRTKDSQDRRRQILTLTDKGAKLLAASETAVERATEASLSALTDKQRAKLISLTRKALGSKDS